MNPHWRDGVAELTRATRILEIELSVKEKRRLLPIPDAGKATWVNERYERGYRGMALDYSTIIWDDIGESSSSCSIEEGGVLKADAHGSFLDHTAGQTANWEKGLGQAGWPFQPCLHLVRVNEIMSYFGGVIEPVAHQFEVYRFYVEQSQRLRGTVPDDELRATLVMGESDAHLYSVVSRIGAQLCDAAEQLQSKKLRRAALDLVDDVAPHRVRGKGYGIKRHELIRIV